MSSKILTRVGLSVWGADMTPELLANILAMTPDASRVAGEPMPPHHTPGAADRGWVYFSSHSAVDPRKDFEEHAGWLLARLDPHRDLIAIWLAKGWQIRLDVTTVINVSAGGPVVSPETLLRMARLGIQTKWSVAFAPNDPRFRE
jgi:hypothetical protein